VGIHLIFLLGGFTEDSRFSIRVVSNHPYGFDNAECVLLKSQNLIRYPGVDLELFHKIPKKEAREALGIKEKRVIF
jgi:hypothetical protein